MTARMRKVAPKGDGRPSDTAAAAFATALLAGAGSGERSTRDEVARADVCTVAEVAAWLGVNRKTVYDAVNRRELPCARLGRRVVLSRAAIEAWLAGGRP